MKKLQNFVLNFVLDVFPCFFAAVDWVCVYGVTELIFNESETRGLLISFTICLCLDVLPGWSSQKFNDVVLWEEDFKWGRWHFLLAASVFFFAFVVYIGFSFITVRSMIMEDPDSWVESWGTVARALIPIATSLGSLWCGFRGTRTKTKKELKELDEREYIIKAKIDEITSKIHRIESTLAMFDPQEVDNEMYQAAVERELCCMERTFWQVHLKLCEALEADPEATAKILNSEKAVKARIDEVREHVRCQVLEDTAQNTAEGSTAKLSLSA